MSTTTEPTASWMREQALKALDGAKAAMEMAGAPFPRIVCLCGSTRFYDAFREANLRRTLAGEIVLSIGCDTKPDADLAAAAGFGADPELVKADLDQLHKRKIDLADYVLVVSDESGYFGESTTGEIRYALEYGKPVEYAEPAAARRARELGLTAEHEHSFPCNPPGGSFWAPGPCTMCGITWDRAQAERLLQEAQAAMAATGEASS